MASKKNARSKKYFSVAEANTMLPLVRSIVNDITQLANSMRERFERLNHAWPEKGKPADLYQEELLPLQAEFERDQERLQEYEQELRKLGIHLKDPYIGLIDFPGWMNDHEVYLCWRQGEPEVAFWHEINAGFSGRQKLVADVAHH